MNNEEDTNIDETMQDAAEKRKQQAREENAAIQEARKKVKDKTEKILSKELKKAKRKAASSMFKSVTASAGVTLFAIIIVLFLIIGIVTFILTMPGLVQDGIFEKVSSVAEKLIDSVHGGQEHLLDTEEIEKNTIDSLNYMNKMGLDPIGLGFVQQVYKDENGDIAGFSKDYNQYANLLKINPSGDLSSNNLIVTKIPSACPMLWYVLSNERTYLPKTYYLKSDGDYMGMSTLLDVSASFFWKTLSPLGVGADTSTYIQKDDGMLVYGLASEGNIAEKVQEQIKKLGIKIDRKNRTMTYNRVSLKNEALINQSYTVDLESWIGRYGMSLELLTALHMATMSSDVTQELINDDNLKTQVHITFDKGSYNVDFEIKVLDDNGRASDFRFGNIDDDTLVQFLSKYKFVDIVYNEETGKSEYVYNADKIKDEPYYTKDAITICSLKKLIDDFKMVTTYANEDFQQDDEGGFKAVAQGMNDLLYGNNNIYLKYDINFGKNNDLPQTEAYIGTYNESEKKGTGFIDGDGTYSYTWVEPGENNGILQACNASNQYRAGLYGSDGTSNSADPVSMRVNVSSSADLSSVRNVVSVPSLKTLSNSPTTLQVFNSQAYARDAMTCFMIELDQYFYDKSRFGDENSSEYDTIRIKYEHNSSNMARVVIDYGGDTEYTMDFSNYNYLLRIVDRSNSFDNGNGENGNYFEMPGYFTRMWLGMLASNGGLSVEEINELTSEMEKYYSETHDIDDNIQNVLDGIWRDKVNPDAKTCPLTAEDINQIYAVISDYTLNAQEMDLSLPRIEKVTNHWFKDVDFTNSYSSGNGTMRMKSFEWGEGKVTVTPLLVDAESLVQTSQPFVIKGNVVTLDGETITEDNPVVTADGQTITDKDVLDRDKRFGKGFEASKKILTSGYYYVYDGTISTSNGILNNKLLESVKPGNMVEVAVTDAGSIHSIRALHKDSEGFTFRIGDSEQRIADLNGNTGMNSMVRPSGATDCTVTPFRETKWVGTSTGDSDSGEEEEYGKLHHYFVYVGGSLEYISPTKANTQEEVETRVERINSLLTELGVGQLRKPISFDNTTSGGDVATLTAFSILEGMKTDNAQIVYRDLKEFLIELGYYTKAEFEYLNNNNLEWFIPDYTPANPEHWRQNDNIDITKYGAMLYPASAFAKYDNEESNEEASEDNDTADDGEDSSEQNDVTESDSGAKGFDAGLDVIAPGNARILDFSNDGDNPYIVLEFDGITEPQIAMLDRYTMTIKGITIETNLVEPGEDGKAIGNISDIIQNKTVIKSGTIIGKTGNVAIQVIMQNSNGAYLSNVEDYMHPYVANIEEGMEYTGSLSQELYYYLGVQLEGMQYTTDEYFTNSNGNVSGGGDNAYGYITVGPGLLMDDGKLSVYIQKGGSNEDNTSLNSRYKKSIIMEMYVEMVDGVYKAKVEELLDGYEVSQTQMEALVLSCYQRGTGSSTLREIINKIKQGASADDLKSIWVVPYSKPGYPGVYPRRYSEWYLYKYGVYINPYSNSHSSGGGTDTPFDFGTETPWQDFLNGTK